MEQAAWDTRSRPDRRRDFREAGPATGGCLL
jgi:hypothetical protein